MAKIILNGFDRRTEQDLAWQLVTQGHCVSLGWQGVTDGGDALFCNADHPDYPAFVRHVRAVRPELPIVVVTSRPEQQIWLDALEAGAADYCCAPFESAEIGRLLAGVLGHAPSGPKPTPVAHV